MNRDLPHEWFVDAESEHKLTLHRIKEQVLAESTGVQRVKILDTYDLGRILVLDNQLQSAEYDEYIYHECLVHPAMALAHRPEKVLILGGGEGATLREVVKYRPVSEITMVDIDRRLVEISWQHLQGWHVGAYGDDRVKVIFTNARDFVENTADRYDVVLMDINDPVPRGPAALIYTREFFQAVRGVLREGGVFATQATAISYHRADRHAVLHRTLAAVFRRVASYGDFIPSFEALWGFIVASDTLQAARFRPREVEERLAARLAAPLKYYDGETHARLFSLPKMVRDNIIRETGISTLDNPLSVFS